MTACHSSSVIFFRVRSRMMPALFTSTSSPPHVLLHLLHQRLDLSRVAHVGREHVNRRLARQRREAVAARASASLRLAPSGSSQNWSTHVAPARANAVQDARADAARAAGDERHLAGEAVGDHVSA